MCAKRELTSVSKIVPTTDSAKKLKLNDKFKNRDALGAYINSPEKYDASRVVSYDQNFVVVNDTFPKSSVHMLLLPRSTKFSHLHPFEAFDDVQFLESVLKQVSRLKEIVAKEIRRKYGPFSKQDARCEAIFKGHAELEGEDLPGGRDWSKDVISGIHARPSMNHLHIHVLSVDRFSKSLKHRKHYNSFATPFFIPIEDFPLAKNDVRRHPEREGYLRSDLICWRCGENFGNKFTSLKNHLSVEFEKWKED